VPVSGHAVKSKVTGPEGGAPRPPAGLPGKMDLGGFVAGTVFVAFFEGGRNAE